MKIAHVATSATVLAAGALGTGFYILDAPQIAVYQETVTVPAGGAFATPFTVNVPCEDGLVTGGGFSNSASRDVGTASSGPVGNAWEVVVMNDGVAFDITVSVVCYL